MKIKPWPKIGQPRVLLEKHNRAFVVQKFVNPTNGATEEFYSFVGKVDSVIIFPITGDKKVIAIRQFRHTADDVFIELPGGNKHSKEPSLNAAKRELLEETGFNSKRISILNKKVWFDPGGIKNFYIPCLAVDCYKISRPQLDNTEIIETVTIPLDKWLNMIYKGKITDGKTLAVTFLALPYIGIKLDLSLNK